MKDKTTDYFIGWDVGAWNCEKNSKSRDAIVILDSSLTIMGQPYRHNLRDIICESSRTHTWLDAIFKACEADSYDRSTSVIMAIDTPLGFSDAFVDLVANRTVASSITKDKPRTNPYLFRETERRLFDKGLTPLSAVTHMIGNQATKGMHAMSKFAPTIESCGVWTDKASLRAIETYPTACRTKKAVQERQEEIQLRNKQFNLQWNDAKKDTDVKDALTCAIVAYLFATAPDKLAPPDKSISLNEGWIWAPRTSP